MAGFTSWENVRDGALIRRTGGGWTIHIDVETGAASDITDDALDRFADRMACHAGVIAGGFGFSTYGCTFSIHTDERDPLVVAPKAKRLFDEAVDAAGLPGGQITELQLMTFAEHDRQLDRPA